MQLKHKKKRETICSFYSLFLFLCWQRLTFPGSFPPSIISDAELNFCVRYGYRWTLCSFVTNFFSYLSCQLNNAKNLLSPSLTSFSIFFWSSPRPISINQLNMSPCLHLWPIYHIVYVGSYLLCSNGKSYLEGGFTLRCLQRLSRPYLATRLCTWQCNRCTIGTSIPVLSY